MPDAPLILDLGCDRTELARLTSAVDEFGAAHHLAEDDVYDLHLVLDEVVINIVKHGCNDNREHAIRVVLALAGGVLTIRTEDDARAFDPTQAPPPKFDLPIEERPIGGLGVHIVRSLVTSMAYERVNGRNVLTMTKKLRT